MHLGFLCGSLQASSSNGSLLAHLRASMPGEWTSVDLDHPRHLPHFNPDLEQAGDDKGDLLGLAEVRDFRRRVAEVDALVIACPEYGHSLPGTLKNAIDWLIGSGELYGKPVAITAAVRHVGRGRRGLDALATTLGAVDARLVWNEAIDVGTPGRIDALIRAIAMWKSEGRPPD